MRFLLPKSDYKVLVVFFFDPGLEAPSTLALAAFYQCSGVQILDNFNFS